MYAIIDSLIEKNTPITRFPFLLLFFNIIDLINLYILNIIRCKYLDL